MSARVVGSARIEISGFPFGSRIAGTATSVSKGHHVVDLDQDVVVHEDHVIGGDVLHRQVDRGGEAGVLAWEVYVRLRHFGHLGIAFRVDDHDLYAGVVELTNRLAQNLRPVVARNHAADDRRVRHVVTPATAAAFPRAGRPGGAAPRRREM
jgi:hypothetical protein